MEHNNSMESLAPAGLSRRQALKKGALAGGLVWVAPTIVSAVLTPAYAEDTSIPGGGGGGTPPPIPHGLPSHGFFLLRTGTTPSNYKYYGFQIVDSGGVVSCLTSPGKGNDVPYMNSVGYPNVIASDKGNDHTWSTIAAQIVAGHGTYPDAPYKSVPVLFLKNWPAGTVLMGAWVWDGSFQTDPDGDKVRTAPLIHGVYYFYK